MQTYTYNTAWAVSNLLAAIWNRESYKTHDATELWQKIAYQEFSRTFSEGWDYCRSQLNFSPESGRSWHYTTTSGTVIALEQGVWFDEDDQLPELICTVNIPDHRIDGCHDSYAKEFAKVEFDEFYGWGTLHYAERDSALYHEAIRRGIEPHCDYVRHAKPLVEEEEEYEEYDLKDGDIITGDEEE